MITLNLLGPRGTNQQVKSKILELDLILAALLIFNITFLKGVGVKASFIRCD